MLIECDCGSYTFNLNFIPPLRCEAICTECEEATEIGGANRGDS